MRVGPLPLVFRMVRPQPDSTRTRGPTIRTFPTAYRQRTCSPVTSCPIHPPVSSLKTAILMNASVSDWSAAMSSIFFCSDLINLETGEWRVLHLSLSISTSRLLCWFVVYFDFSTDNVFNGAEVFKLDNSTDTYWSGNTIGAGCMKSSSSSFASGSDAIPSCWRSPHPPRIQN